MNNYRVEFNTVSWQTAPSGARFKVHKEGSMQLRLLEFGRDLNHPDWCVMGHIGFLLEGEMEIEFDDETLSFKTGDGIIIPAGESYRHRPKAISEKVQIVFVEET